MTNIIGDNPASIDASPVSLRFSLLAIAQSEHVEGSAHEPNWHMLRDWVSDVDPQAILEAIEMPEQAAIPIFTGAEENERMMEGVDVGYALEQLDEMHGRICDLVRTQSPSLVFTLLLVTEQGVRRISRLHRGQGETPVIHK